MLRSAKYYAGGELRDTLGDTQRFCGDTDLALGREGRLSRTEWERKKHMKGTEVLTLLFLGGWEEA